MPAVEGNFLDCPRIDDLAYGARRRFNNRRICRHSHLFGDPADVQLEIPNYSLADFQGEAAHNLRFHSLQPNFDLVDANRQCCDLIVSRFIAERRALDTCSLISYIDRGARQHRARLIGNQASNRRIGLAEQH